VLHVESQLLLEQLEAQLLQRSEAGRRIIVESLALIAAMSSSSELTGITAGLTTRPTLLAATVAIGVKLVSGS
jgi:hypothetical protein